MYVADDVNNKPVIENPPGTNSPKYAIHILNNSSDRAAYISFRGLHLYGGYEVRGQDTGNGESVGLFTDSGPHDIEFLLGEIDGFQGFSYGEQASAQAFLLTQGGSARPGTGIKFIYNRIHGIGTAEGTAPFNEHGCYVQTLGTLILNNLFYDMVNGFDCQFYAGAGGEQALIADNTLVDAHASGVVIDGSASGVRMINNIYAYHTARGSSSNGIEFYPAGGGASNSILNYGLYFDNSGGDRSSTPPGWTFTHELNADPRFVDPGGDNYHLTASSPAIGFTDTTYSTPFDLDGVVRPPGLEDAGAYQFSTSGTTQNDRGTR